MLFLTMMHIFNALSIFAPGLVHFAFTPRLLRTHSESNPTFFGGVEFTCLLRYLIRIGKMLRSHLKDNSDYPKQSDNSHLIVPSVNAALGCFLILQSEVKSKLYGHFAKICIFRGGKFASLQVLNALFDTEVIPVMWSPSIGQTEPEPTRVTMGVAIEVLRGNNVTRSDVAHEYVHPHQCKGRCWLATQLCDSSTVWHNDDMQSI